jgi:hypothetical protein
MSAFLSREFLCLGDVGTELDLRGADDQCPGSEILHSSVGKGNRGSYFALDALLASKDRLRICRDGRRISHQAANLLRPIPDYEGQEGATVC